MVHLTNERAALLDGYLRDIQAAADDIQRGATGTAAPILAYCRDARALLAQEIDRGDPLSAVNTDTPEMWAHPRPLEGTQMEQKPKLERGEWWCVNEDTEETCHVFGCHDPVSAAEKAAQEFDEDDEGDLFHIIAEDDAGNRYRVFVWVSRSTTYDGGAPTALPRDENEPDEATK